ncbi:hypothetical protein Krad_3906 [Kineococcus radiotolerans SRS30216 = ATCC BAA-149]|uniref:Uncharacterized protein n=1 Tax=Kineococcus radiotolerans (strain ATCC BAA-149 / DSM 14245 / SRS30216) TaxID=266940 RepID=A6WEY0_KINRD|nr:hypothetical protein Krad_3906 [Kineococcus radiotolerans SRS30216 = ATCC BAA-149]
MPPRPGWVTLGGPRRSLRGAPTEGGVPLLTVLACVTLVVLGIVGAVKMEDHLDPRADRSETRARSER